MNLESAAKAALGCMNPVPRANFAADPEGVLREMGFTIRPVEHLSNERSDGGFCDGMSFLEDGVILYSPTPNSRRQNFTLAHELGHWLVEKADHVLGWIVDQRNPQQVLESICDRIARDLLLPQAAVETAVGGQALRAYHVFKLYGESQASFPACAIALAGKLPGLGAVVLINRYTHEVDHASVRPDPEQGWPLVFPWRGQLVSDSHPLLAISTGAQMTKRITWRTPWNAAHDFFANAMADDRRLIVVLSDVDLWSGDGRRILEERQFDRRPQGRIFCCGEDQMVRGYPCPTCHEQFCPKCRRCRCDRAAKRDASCSRCFMVFAPQLLVNGLCESCR